MRTLLATVALLAALPHPAGAAAPLRAYVVERVSLDATDPGINGGTWAADGEYAYAAVAAVTTTGGRLQAAEGALFFGVTAESDPSLNAPATGPVRCSGTPVAGQACASVVSAGAIAFAVWWEGAAFDRVVVAMRGRDQRVGLLEGVRGWRLRPWRGTVREVAGDLAGATASPYGAGSFVDAEAVGGPGGSVAIGHPPCAQVGYASLGAGAVRLLGGTREAVSSCGASLYPPAAAAPGSTEWSLSGAAAGVADVPVRMVVIEAPARR